MGPASLPFLLVLSLCSSSLAFTYESQYKSLLAFKSLIRHDPYDSLVNWTRSIPLCNWTGVTCKPRSNRVVAISLSDLKLEGSISPLVGNLSFLHLLDLSYNALSGHIPSEMGRLFRLKELYLAGNRMEGIIPPALGNCRHLRELALSDNKLTGSISVQLGFLRNLQFLYLGSNNFSGTVPSFLGNLSELIELELPNNNLRGFIPVNLGLLTHLETLVIFGNELSGTIPISLSNISTLIELILYSNHLTGAIPQELGLLQNLQRLYLHENDLSGTIPASLLNISNLIELGVYRNHLTGAIPGELGSLSHLQVLYLYQNNFTGTIPASLSNISSLSDLEISMNQLTGIIPQEFGMLKHMQTLYLFGNQLRGEVPSSLSNCSSLEELYLGENQLTGNIPSELGIKLSNLSFLSLWGNQLIGNIPNSLGNCTKLEELHLDDNMLSGIVPIELGNLALLRRLQLNTNLLVSGSSHTLSFITALSNCSVLEHLSIVQNKLSGVLPHTIGQLSTKLSVLALSKNSIGGNIPHQIGNLTSVTYLDLHENLFSGSIPSVKRLGNLERLRLENNGLEGIMPNDFDQVKHLGLLTMSNNMLGGKIPDSFCQLQQLRRLSLHHNRLSESIPACLGNCKNLELLDLSYNRLKGSIPREVVNLPNLQFYLNLSWNSLEGTLPTEISKLVMARAIDITSNQLTGVIPASLGSCTALESLYLSGNSFRGSIPDTLGNLQNLVDLDLSYNSLTGKIPVTFKKLKILRYLNLSFNSLTGEIAREGVSANQTIILSLIGNPGLCGPQVFLLPPCSIHKIHSSLAKKVLIPVVSVSAFIFCFLLVGFLWRGGLFKERFDFSQVNFQRLEHRRILHQELIMATGGFLQANLLGTGSFGSVNKGILSDGTPIAVKVLHLQNEQALKSFKAECNVLRKVRHRNLVRIITSCSTPDFKGLVFEYMPNGSLEQHLYPREEICGLGLERRLNIAKDVARALEYLHYDSAVQVVHCDIKPSNVLLDEDMTSHLTDFGIAKLANATMGSLSSTVALNGSIGYIAPEYGVGERVSTQGDVYSYGILLLEMLTRKRPTREMFVENLDLHKWVVLAFPNSLAEVIDDSLLREVAAVGDEIVEENYAYRCLFHLVHVGLHCSKSSPEERPTMRDVATLMESIEKDFVGAGRSASGRLRRSISSLLESTSAARNDESYDRSSSTS